MTTAPSPVPATEPDPSCERTVDAFHRGAFMLVQPAGRAHRAGLDAMILAAAVPGSFSGRLADLGAGAGAAGMAVAARCPKARIALVERDDLMCEFALATLEHPENAAVAGRGQVIKADIALKGAERKRAGLADCAYDFVIMNPPFNDRRDRASADALRRHAHVMVEDLFEDWLRTAAAIARPGAGLALIARPASVKPVLDAIEQRFGRAQILPIHPRPHESAIRFVLRAQKGSRGALSIGPPLVLHGDSGHQFDERAQAVINGQATLFGD